MSVAIDPTLFRTVMGQYPTGVVVVTALSQTGEPIGMTVGSFNSASLDPALVAFMPDRGSNSWRALREAGDSFAVNVLGAQQEDICRAVATRKVDKFVDIAWHLSEHGNPVIDGCAAFIDCKVEQIYEAGDHDIVLGKVRGLSIVNATEPLLFFRGGYGSFTPASLAAADADLLGHLRLIDSARPHMDELARAFDTSVTASCLVRNELVLAAASGSNRDGSSVNQVGRRVPFQPPFGSAWAAWGPEELNVLWTRGLEEIPEPRRSRFAAFPDLVRTRGFVVTLREPDDPADVWSAYNPEHVTGDEHRLESVTAPVFDAEGRVAFALTIWGPNEPISDQRMSAFVHALVEAAHAATGAIGGRKPRLAVPLTTTKVH